MNIFFFPPSLPHISAWFVKLILPCDPRSIIRPMISNPQLHGARLVATVLNDPKLTAQWNQ
jgi:hypothetical protein